MWVAVLDDRADEGDGLTGVLLAMQMRVAVFDFSLPISCSPSTTALPKAHLVRDMSFRAEREVSERSMMWHKSATTCALS